MTARPHVVVLGRQGSGKGTQGMRLASQLGVPHLSTGDLFRAAVRAGTEVGAEVDHLLKEGLLVPDDLVIDVVRDEAERSQWSVTGYVLDGFPRTVAQAEAFFGTPHIDLPPEAPAHGAFDVAISLEVPMAEARRRMATRRVCPVCGTIVSVDDAAIEAIPCPRGDGTAVRRGDDRDDAIDRRLALYERETGPLAPWFAAWGRLVTVDGTGTADAVYQRLVDSLAPFVGLTAVPPH
jgi:adenylate kinase